jgi:hypothetical protein
MKVFLSTLLLVLFVGSASAQKEAIRCVVTLYGLHGENWKLAKSVQFVPKLGEEELTNKTVRLRAALFLLASVFPTDESMHSARGADSLKLGLAVSRKKGANAFDLANNAVAEGTLNILDTLRVERTIQLNHKLMLTRLECWDPNLEKDKGR